MFRFHPGAKVCHSNKNMMMELVLWKCKRTQGQVHAAALQSTSFWGTNLHSLNIESKCFGRTWNCLWQQMGQSPHPFCETAKSWSKKIDTDWHMWSWCMENPPTLNLLWSLYQLWFCGYQSVGCNANNTLPLPSKAKQIDARSGIDLWSEVVGC
jgi:hypothetical protein